MASDDGFPAHLFPASFTLLYCPYGECNHETPFTDPESLIQHTEEAHGLLIANKSAVIPFLDRYLGARVELGAAPLSTQEDEELREHLQQQRLREILDQQEQERTTSYKRGRHCLFCSLHFPTLPLLFAHMFQEHGFNIGQLDNLVMVDEFLSLLQTRLDRLSCIFCEGRFPSTPVLKNHLKNKNHYRIHPQNHAYDKFYVVNYLRAGKLYDEETARTERDQEEGREGAEAEWEELTEAVDERTMCLLCPHILEKPDECIYHMQSLHGFDWPGLREEAQLDTYEAIKLINYLRVCLAEVVCMYCGQSEDSEEQLVEHLRTHLPHQIPDKKLWKDPRYLFPIYEDDPLLCHLDDK